VTQKAPTRKKAAAKKNAARAAAPEPADSDGVAAPGPDGATTVAAHRPSRRHLIIDAAIRVFARKGFAEGSIQEIADEAGMVATAVYYHFAGKEELFEAALAHVIDANSQVIRAARPDEAPASPDIFKDVVTASWGWAEQNPDMARLLFMNATGGATAGSRVLMRAYQDRAVRRGYDYFTTELDTSRRRGGAAHHAARTLAVRTVIGLALAVHPLHLEGGPLSGVSASRIRSATGEVAALLYRNG
jgi:AcrR family transcriptional regulator